MIFDLFVKPAYASCPVCIITVGGGLFIAKKLGIDDLLVSIWLSGLNTAVAFWLATKIKNKFFSNSYLLAMIFYLLTLIYLFYSKQLFHVKNTLWGVDKVFFGMTAGLIVFFISNGIDQLLRKKNKGKVVFYYQKVIIPIISLTVTTLIFKLFFLK
jgi:hypothetical protein